MPAKLQASANCKRVVWNASVCCMIWILMLPKDCCSRQPPPRSYRRDVPVSPTPRRARSEPRPSSAASAEPKSPCAIMFSLFDCLCSAGHCLGMARRCLSTRRLNLGIHFGFHVMALVDCLDAEVRKESDDQQSGHDVHGGVVGLGLRH